ncbi:MAG: LytR family transcriptional regulator [Propionibacteriales bacterium]|nr:LytR family transcriptional regulator [Propionibacteriales bacterium]
MPAWFDVFRRHKAAWILLGLVAVGLAGLSGFALYLNAQLGNIDTFVSKLPDDVRATKIPRAGEAQNILLLGVDKGSVSETIEEELADGEWSPGAFRSDTMMILHIPEDRRSAYLVSIPRDSYVQVPGYGMQKINAAFSYGGPDLAVHTVEKLTGVYLDHVAMLDWAGFKDLTTAIGGVEVQIAETFTDTHNDVHWEAGTHHLQGEMALEYVRTRYGLAEGDFDRIQRQQNFLRAVMSKTLSQGTLANPLKLKDLLEAVADSTTVDERFSPGLMRSLALETRDLRTGDVVFLTAPTAGFDDTDVGNVVLLDKKEGKALWTALRKSNLHKYLNKYGGERLGEPDEIP